MIGPLAAEVINTLIPKQREDRIARLLEIIAIKVKNLERKHLEAQFANPGFIDLLEDGLWQAARALTEDRIQYIACLLKNSLSEKELKYERDKRLLVLLSELNDVEIIILLSHTYRTEAEAEKFREEHKAVLTESIPFLNASQEELDKASIDASHRNHLLRLGLIKPRFHQQSKGELPEFDSTTGTSKSSGHEITGLGRMLLRKLDLAKSSKE